MRHRIAMVVAALTFGVAVATTPPPAAHAAIASVPSDFNGDGYSDLAVGVPGHDLGGHINVGQVNVIYGSATGLTAAGDQVWWQGSPGIKGVPEGRDGPPGARLLGDAFGGQLASGDFDGDGYADLAVTSTYDREAGDALGAVNVIYGGPAGLHATGDQLFSPANSAGRRPRRWREPRDRRLRRRRLCGPRDERRHLERGEPLSGEDCGAFVLHGSGTGLTLIDRTELWMGHRACPIQRASSAAW